jgi:predicted alpha/beta-hydrolase family hydrolase
MRSLRGLDLCNLRECGAFVALKRFDVALENDRVTTANHYAAEKPAGTLLVLAHGAGAGQAHPFMVKAAEGLAARGIDVVTFDFPYMHAKRGAPDKAPVLESCFRRVIEASRARKGLGDHRLFIGGKSMGGRMATHLGAQDVAELNGIVVLGYPLHPPGQPDKLRVAHLPAITVPVLILQGEKDAFGAPGEFKPHLKTMKTPALLHAIAGADHSLTVRSKKGTDVFEGILTFIADWISEQ